MACLSLERENENLQSNFSIYIGLIYQLKGRGVSGRMRVSISLKFSCALKTERHKKRYKKVSRISKTWNLILATTYETLHHFYGLKRDSS